MKILAKKAGLIVMVTGCLCLLAATVALAESDERFYVRFAGADQEISKDFDGAKSFTLNSITVNAPKLKKATGYGFAFGSQSGHVGGELSYFKTNHDSEGGAFGDTFYETLNYDVKIMLMDPMKLNIVPFALVGGSYNRVGVENGANNYKSDAEYTGFGYKLGAGMVIRFNNNLGVEGTYTIGRTTLDKVKAVGAEGDPGFKLESKVLAVSLNYYF